MLCHLKRTAIHQNSSVGSCNSAILLLCVVMSLVAFSSYLDVADADAAPKILGLHDEVPSSLMKFISDLQYKIVDIIDRAVPDVSLSVDVPNGDCIVKISTEKLPKEASIIVYIQSRSSIGVVTRSQFGASNLRGLNSPHRTLTDRKRDVESQYSASFINGIEAKGYSEQFYELDPRCDATSKNVKATVVKEEEVVLCKFPLLEEYLEKKNDEQNDHVGADPGAGEKAAPEFRPLKEKEKSEVPSGVETDNPTLPKRFIPFVKREEF